MKKVTMRAWHFKGHQFCEYESCPLAEAAKDEFKTQFVKEGVRSLTVNNKTMYHHKRYSRVEYDLDYKKASDAGFDETIIRMINLIPYE